MAMYELWIWTCLCWYHTFSISCARLYIQYTKGNLTNYISVLVLFGHKCATTRCKLSQHTPSHAVILFPSWLLLYFTILGHLFVLLLCSIALITLFCHCIQSAHYRLAFLPFLLTCFSCLNVFTHRFPAPIHCFWAPLLVLFSIVDNKINWPSIFLPTKIINCHFLSNQYFFRISENEQTLKQYYYNIFIKRW